MNFQRISYFFREIFLDWPRIGRKDFICWQLLWCFCFVALSMQGLALSLFVPPTPHEIQQHPLPFPLLTTLTYFVYFLFFGAFTLETLFLTFKQVKVMSGRLRDFNVSGWLAAPILLFFLLAPQWLPPLVFISVCIVFLSILTFWPGSAHENRYGPVDDRLWQCRWHAKFCAFLLFSFVALSCFLYYLIPSSILSFRFTLFALFFIPH